VERSIAGRFTVNEHIYKLNEFNTHVDNIAHAAGEFITAVGGTQEEVNEFVQAAFSLNRKSSSKSSKD
jgi:hypothetical protein